MAKKRKKPRRHHIEENALYQVLTHFLQVETMDYPNTSLNFIALILTLWSFFIFLYLKNSLNTSLVVQEKPNMVESYDDLLRMKGVQIIFTAYSDDHYEFEKARPGTKEHQVWHKALENSKKEDLLLKGIHLDSMFALMTEVMRGKKIVGMLSNMIAFTTQCMICAAKAQLFNEENVKTFKGVNIELGLRTHTYVSEDPNVKSQLIGSVISANFTSPLSKRIYKRKQIMFESGIPLKVLKSMARPVLPLEEMNSFQRGVYKRCIAHNYRDNMDQQEDVKPVQAKQFKQAFMALGVLIMVAFYVLIAESIKQRVLSLHSKAVRLNR